MNPKVQKGIENAVSACPDWIKDRLCIAYDSLSHLILIKSNSILSNSAVTVGMTGRTGIQRTYTPINPSSDLETWLSAVAVAIGAKDAATMSKRRQWEDVCMALIREDRNLSAFLKVVEMETERTRDTPQFFSPETCRQALQMKGAKGPTMSKWAHEVPN